MQQHGLDIDEPWSGSSSPISRLPGCKLTKPPRSSHGYTWPTDTQLGASGSQQPLARSASQTVRGLSRATTAQLRLGRLALNGVEGFKSCCAATNSPPVPEQAGAAESIQTKLDSNPAVLFVIQAPGKTILGLGNAVVTLCPDVAHCHNPKSGTQGSQRDAAHGGLAATLSGLPDAFVSLILGRRRFRSRLRVS